jgi:hypothetical protein
LNKQNIYHNQLISNLGKIDKKWRNYMEGGISTSFHMPWMTTTGLRLIKQKKGNKMNRNVEISVSMILGHNINLS